jgi:hypothetical protein
METDPVSEMSCFLEYWTMEKVQKNPVNSVQFTYDTYVSASPKNVIPDMLCTVKVDAEVRLLLNHHKKGAERKLENELFCSLFFNT